MLKIPPEFRDIPEAEDLRRADAAFAAAIEQERRATERSGERVHFVSERLRHAQEELRRAEEAFDAATGEPKRVGLTPPVLAELSRQFPAHQHQLVTDLLDESCGRTLPLMREATAEGLEFIRLAVLQLSKGDLPTLRKMIECAHIDWRTVVLAAKSK